MTIDTTRSEVERTLRLAVTNRHITPAIERLALAILERAEDAEVDANRLQAICEDRISDVRLVSFQNGHFNFEGGPVKYIAEYFAQIFEDGHGKYFNNMEIEFQHDKAGAMVLSAQRKAGLTPTQQRKAAEAERDTLQAEVERLKAALRFYADGHTDPNEGPWGVNSRDFGTVAIAALYPKPTL